MPKETFPKTKAGRAGASRLWIELRPPFGQLLKKVADSENRSAKAQAEVIIVQHLKGSQPELPVTTTS